jgi:hypothetical protein
VAGLAAGPIVGAVLHFGAGAISACVEPTCALPDFDPAGRQMRMGAAGAVGGLDGGLKVEDVQIFADNDLILVVEAVESEFGHGSGLPFQRIGPGAEIACQLEQQLFHIVIGKLVRHLQQAQGSDA